jgi:LexA DNA binding domain
MMPYKRRQRADEPTPLTRRQKAVLDFIRNHLAANGVAPTFQEIADNIGFRAKSTAFRIVSALESGRYLTVTSRGGGRGVNRGIVLTKPLNALTIVLPLDLEGEVANLALIAKCSREEIVVEATRDGLRLHRSTITRAALKVAL